MPLLDHFQSPWSADWPWDGVHANWATKIADGLNAGFLPPDYHAISLVKRGGRQRSLVAALEFNEEDVFEIQVLRQLGGARLRAVVELASPANKDRPSSRRAFAVKCASYLSQSVSVVIIDVVTDRRANLHAELMNILQINGEPPWQSPTHLYAIAHRIVQVEAQSRIETWREPLAIGGLLPTLPLWLEPDFSVPLRLEESYGAMWKSLRIPV